MFSTKTERKLNYENGRMLNDIKLKELPSDFVLRDVQKTMLDMTREAIRKGNRHIVQHLSTAGGKTVWAGYVFYLAFQKDPGCQCWFIVNRNTLLKQTKDELEKFFGFDCGIVQGQQPIELNKHVQIATIQTLHNRLTSDNPVIWREFNNLPVKIACADECHLRFKGYETVRDAWDPLILGLTGTPFTQGMAKFWDDMVRPAKMKELIDNETLSDYRVKVCVAVKRENLSTNSTGEYVDDDVEKEVANIIGDVYQEWADSEDMKGRSFIGFSRNISTCIALAEKFTDHNVPVAYVHSKMSDETVQEILDAFKGGLYIGVFSVAKLIEGFNFPEVSALIMCNPMAPSKHDPNIPNSCNRYVQSFGRGARQHKGKDYCLIHDHTGNFMQYGDYELIEDYFPVLDDGKPKKKTTNPAERKKHVVRECPECHMAMKGGQCKYCGVKTKKPTQFLEAGDLNFIEGEMVEVKRSKKQKNKSQAKDMGWPEKIKFYGQLKQYCIDKKKKPGFAAHCWKSFAGTWPNDRRFKDAPCLPVGENVRHFILKKQIAFAKGKQNETTS